MRSVADILDDIRRRKSLESDAALGALFGVRQSTVASWRGRGSLPYDEIIAFCDKEGISTDELFLGKAPLAVAEHPPVWNGNGGRFCRLAVHVLAGAGNPAELMEQEPVDEIIVPKELYRPGIVPIKVRGKSMEPLILDGAVVGVDRDDVWVVSGEIYAVWLPYEGAVIKRLYLDTEKLTLKSDNPKFPDITVPLQGLSEHLIQGRVKWVVQEI